MPYAAVEVACTSTISFCSAMGRPSIPSARARIRWKPGAGSDQRKRQRESSSAATFVGTQVSSLPSATSTRPGRPLPWSTVVPSISTRLPSVSTALSAGLVMRKALGSGTGIRSASALSPTRSPKNGTPRAAMRNRPSVCRPSQGRRRTAPRRDRSTCPPGSPATCRHP